MGAGIDWKQVCKTNLNQVLFVFSAFFLMVLISCLSVSEVIQRAVLSSVTITLNENEKTIRSYLREPRIAFNNIYVSLQDLLDRGESQKEIEEYLHRTGQSLSRPEEGVLGFAGVYAFIREEFVDGADSPLDANFVPQQRPWYQIAIRNQEAIYTAPYADAKTGNLVTSLAREVYGKNGDYYGVLSMDIDLAWMFDYVASLAPAEGGYGMLVNQYLYLISHPNPEHKNRQLRDLGGDYAAIADALHAGDQVTAKRITDTDGSSAIVFFRELYNSWHVGMIIPASHYYADLLRTALILLGIGLAMAFTLSYLLLRLSAAKMQSDVKSRSKSSFLATMSHEIRTPLNAILGLTEIQLNKKLPEDTTQALEKIYLSGTNLLGIINDILDVSKIEAGNLELISEDYSLPALVNDAVQLNIVRIGNKPIVFELELNEDLPTRLCGDEIRVKQVLNNLLSNAIKYTRQGRVTLGVAWEIADNGGHLVFTVRDTGIGIKPEDINHLFNEYAQMDASANRHIEGTGLGLNITLRLVEQMDGTITVTSEYGEGSVFIVRLHQTVADAQPIGQEQAESLRRFQLNDVYKSRKRNFVRTPMPYARVLVVDDIPTNLDVAQGLLQPYGMTIDCLASGREAVERLKDSSVRYDAVFMDHMMPGMDGVEATRIIRKDLNTDYARTVPIIALTANALTGNEDMFLANGFDAYISKPIDVFRLDALLKEWIHDRHSDTPQNTIQHEQPKNTIQHEQPTPEQADGWANLEALAAHGLDIEDARERYPHEGMYLKILRSYLKHAPGILDSLRVVSAETLADYAITVHGLKGSSLGIGATEVGHLAAVQEQAAKNGNIDAVLVGNNAMLAAAEALLAGLEIFLAGLDNNAVKPVASGLDAATLHQLLKAVSTFDIVGMDAALAMLKKAECGKPEDAELLRWLTDQVERLKCDALNERLQAELRRRGVTV